MAGSESKSILNWKPQLAVDRDDYVYFIRNRHAGLIKIGRSFSPNKRVFEVARDVLKLEASIKLVGSGNSSSLENHLHKHFKETRVEGEWFAESEELLKLIKEAKSGAFNG